MRASILDLRYRTKDVLKAIERREKVEVLYHGKLKAEIVPPSQPGSAEMRIEDHPYFGMTASKKKSVSRTMADLRKGRYSDL